jgi:hypothetical protein
MKALRRAKWKFRAWHTRVQRAGERRRKDACAGPNLRAEIPML